MGISAVKFFSRACAGVAAASSLAAAVPVQAQGDAITPALIQKAAQANFGEFFEMLALPNDSIKPADIQANARVREVYLGMAH